MLAKCVLTILELNWSQRFRDKNKKLDICHHMPTSSTQLPNRSFHIVERTRMSKNEKYTCKASKTSVFRCLICKFLMILSPSTSWLLKLPNSDGSDSIKLCSKLDHLCATHWHDKFSRIHKKCLVNSKRAHGVQISALSHFLAKGSRDEYSYQKN